MNEVVVIKLVCCLRYADVPVNVLLLLKVRRPGADRMGEDCRLSFPIIIRRGGGKMSIYKLYFYL